MATATPVTINPIEPNPEALEEVMDGLRGALHAMDTRQWDFAYDQLTGEEIQPDAVRAFDSIIDEVARDAAPAVAERLAAAMNRRLPWTWEPER